MVFVVDIVSVVDSCSDKVVEVDKSDIVFVDMVFVVDMVFEEEKHIDMVVEEDK